MIPLKDFVKVVGGEFISGSPHSLVGRASTDSRLLSEGDCFFALKGAEGGRDGHDFIKDAALKNAAVIVFSRDDISIGGDDKILLGFPALVKVKDTLRALGDYAKFVRSKFEGKVVCTVGSNGKTTVKYMIYSILSKVGKTHKSPGNYNNLIGLPLSILSLEGDESYTVLEAGISVKGEMERLGEISAPDVAVITNIGREHLEGLKNMETVFEEETKIFRNLREGGFAVINMDDRILADFATNLRRDYRGRIVVVGFSIEKNPSGNPPPADLFARDINYSADGVSFTLIVGDRSANIVLKVMGAFNVSNALAAAAACFALGVSLEKIKEGLETFEPLSGRMQKLTLPNGCVIVNDAYNANPDSMRASLSAFMEAYPQRAKILVIGDMLELGERSAQEHISLAEFIMTLPFEEILLVGKNMLLAYSKMKEIHESAAVKHFTSAKELADEILADKRYVSSSDKVLFFKGSHSVGLEDIANKLYRIRALEV